MTQPDPTDPAPRRTRPARTGDGRKADSAATRARLIEAAAKLFAEQGFQGVSIREIALAAGVNSALVNYHFGSKQALFEEVIRIHAADNVADRMARLAQERRRLGRLELEDVLEIYLAPLLEPPAGLEVDGMFSRLHAVMVTERIDAFDQIAARAFSAVNGTFLDELERCLPHLTRQTITWRLFAIIGAMLYFGIRPAPPGLIAISEGRCDPTDRQGLRQHVMPFFIEGMRAPLR